jgi:UDP-N-acetylglucosamine acyltransferase
MRRRGFKADEMESVEEAFKLIYRSGKVLAEVKTELAQLAASSPQLRLISDFIQSGKRPLQR